MGLPWENYHWEELLEIAVGKFMSGITVGNYRWEITVGNNCWDLTFGSYNVGIIFSRNGRWGIIIEKYREEIT